jgi:hypothetical protein
MAQIRVAEQPSAKHRSRLASQNGIKAKNKGGGDQFVQLGLCLNWLEGSTRWPKSHNPEPASFGLVRHYSFDN